MGPQQGTAAQRRARALTNDELATNVTQIADMPRSFDRFYDGNGAFRRACLDEAARRIRWNCSN